MGIYDLKQYGFPDSIVDIWYNSDYEELLPIQEEAINRGLFDGNNLLVVAPTSSGKTFVGEMAAILYALKGKKVYILFHLKQLQMRNCENFKIDTTTLVI